MSGFVGTWSVSAAAPQLCARCAKAAAGATHVDGRVRSHETSLTEAGRPVTVAGHKTGFFF